MTQPYGWKYSVLWIDIFIIIAKNVFEFSLESCSN